MGIASMAMRAGCPFATSTFQLPRESADFAWATLEGASISDGNDAMRELPSVRGENSNIQVSRLPQRDR